MMHQIMVGGQSLCAYARVWHSPPACESLGIPYPTSVRAKIYRVQLVYGGSFGVFALPFHLISFDGELDGEDAPHDV